ncbi:MAG: rod shape-determining protein [Candidatus Parcubacteria bacterium]|nr:MAG: rod shape-determining protein [Candidatus Parcubacteria bacterium]
MLKIVKQLELGIDLGTSNTLVYLKNRGVIFDEPSYIVFDKRNLNIIAIGKEAKKMVGRAPQYLNVVKPINFGIVTDFESTTNYLTKILEIINKEYFSLLRPKAIIGIPLNLTEVQIRGVIDAGISAGFKDVYTIEQPIAAALGGNLDIDEAKGLMIVDIGGGTTEISVISLGGIVTGKSIKIAGDRFNSSFLNYIRLKHNLIVGESQIEEAKIKIGSIVGKNNLFNLRGRDTLTTLPKEITISSHDLREAISPLLIDLIDEIKDILNITPAELIGDIVSRGIYLTGGGSLIEGLSEFMENELNVKVNKLENPLHSVVLGLGKIIENFEHYKKFCYSNSKVNI